MHELGFSNIFSLIADAISSLSWSADIITALSVAVSALLFIRNQKLERLNEKRSRIAESAKAPIVDYVFKSLESMVSDTLQLRKVINHESVISPEDFGSIDLLINTDSGFVMSALNGDNDALETIKFHDFENIRSFSQTEPYRNLFHHEFIEKVTLANQPIIEKLTMLSAMLRPILTSYQGGDNILNSFNDHTKNHRSISHSLQDRYRCTNYIFNSFSNSKDSIEHILLGALEFDSFLNSSNPSNLLLMPCPGVDQQHGTFCINYLDNEQEKVAAMKTVIKEIVAPREKDIGRITLLVFCFKSFIECMAKDTASDFREVSRSADEALTAISGLLQVLVRDPSTWTTDAPLEEAISKIQAAI